MLLAPLPLRVALTHPVPGPLDPMNKPLHHLPKRSQPLDRILTVLAMLAALVIAFQKAEHQPRDEHRRFVLRVCGDDSKVGGCGLKYVSPKTHQTGWSRRSPCDATYVARAPDRDEKQGRRELVPRWTLSAPSTGTPERGQHTRGGIQRCL